MWDINIGAFSFFQPLNRFQWVEDGKGRLAASAYLFQSLLVRSLFKVHALSKTYQNRDTRFRRSNNSGIFCFAAFGRDPKLFSESYTEIPHYIFSEIAAPLYSEILVTPHLL